MTYNVSYVTDQIRVKEMHLIVLARKCTHYKRGIKKQTYKKFFLIEDNKNICFTSTTHINTDLKEKA